jgi:hypothetical protein
MERVEDARALGQPDGDDSFPGVGEGGLRGERTPYAGGYDRQPVDEMVAIDAARGHADAPGAGPNSDADTLIDDPHASRDNRA